MRRHLVQDATGVLTSKPPVGVLDVVLATAPTNSQPGFAPGCFYRNTAGAAGSIVFVNIGSNTSSTWQAIA